MNWQKSLKIRIKKNEPLKNKTTFKIGGRAEGFAEPKDAGDLSSLVVLAKKHKIPVFILGAGSNLLVSDRGVKGIIVKLDSPFFKKISFSGDHVKAGAGLTLTRLVLESKKRSLSGLEFLIGIPGTVGGALTMNAGAWGGSIADCVEELRVMDYNGNIKYLRKKDIKFAYRSLNLGKYIILDALFKLARAKRRKIDSAIKKNLAQRRKTQDNTSPNAGCVFKNPPGNSAGRLIDLCGLKGKRAGGAEISERHANFILNKKNASSSDVLNLMGLAKKAVKNKFKVTLKPEIKIWR
jgi:UDP-N-acetylmuramate dehydrogenase